MLASSTSCSRRGRFSGSSAAATSVGSPTTASSRPRLPFKLSTRAKPLPSPTSIPTDLMGLTRAKRLKARKTNGFQKMDINKKKSSDYTELAYREAVSKLKYLLAESYAPKSTSGKFRAVGNLYRASNIKINESAEDTDDRSVISDYPKTKDMPGNLPSVTNSYALVSKSFQRATTNSTPALSPADMQSVPPEVSTFIEKQEEYIEQLERESHYCKDELSNLLNKVREVIAENEALHNKNKSGFIRSVLEDHKDEERNTDNNKREIVAQLYETKKPVSRKLLEGPSIVFESRISELEAQLTQAKLELRKMHEENQGNAKRLCENCLHHGGPEVKAQLEQVVRDKYEVESKLEEMQRALAVSRDKESEASQKAKRASNLLQQAEFDKSQAEKEIRRLKEELDRQHEKIREVSQEANRRISEERQHVERRYSQQVEQLSADIAAHWDAASKSQLESEKQRRELADLRRELTQKQIFIDNLKKDLQNKISTLQTDLNQALTEKDGAEQEILSAKLSVERNERQARQEQNRLQTEINSYKQRVERADADILHFRRENMRLSEQIAALEKEISMTKIAHSEDSRVQATPGAEKHEKELTSMIMDVETKHEGGVEGDVGRVGVATLPLTKKRSLKVDLKVKVIPKRKSSHSEASKLPLSAQEEMASLQSNIAYLSAKVQEMINNQQEITLTKDCDESVREHKFNTASESFKPEEETHPVPEDQDIVQEPAESEKEGPIQMQEQQQEYVSCQQQQESEAELERTGIDSEQRNELQDNEQEAIMEEKYDSENQGFPIYPEQYNQYEQYNQSQYQDQQYDDNCQYREKEIEHEGQYYTEEPTKNPDTATPNHQYAH